MHVCAVHVFGSVHFLSNTINTLFYFVSPWFIPRRRIAVRVCINLGLNFFVFVTKKRVEKVLFIKNCCRIEERFTQMTMKNQCQCMFSLSLFSSRRITAEVGIFILKFFVISIGFFNGSIGISML